MMHGPPGGRPPGPPISKAPPVHPNSPNITTCETQTGMSHDAFWGGVKDTITREVQRLSHGSENLDKSYTITPVVQQAIMDLIEAFKEGQRVPGLAVKSDASGKCIMNWYALACFSRWYAGLSGEKRDYVRQQISFGVDAKELIDDEAVGQNWDFCTGKEPDDEKDICCPAELLDDWYYKELTQGRVPLVEPQSSYWLPVAFLGFGIFAVAITLRMLAQSHHPNPGIAASVRTGDTQQRQRIRSEIAGRHSFEQWDELREQFADGGAMSSQTFGAANDLDRLVTRLTASGVRTDAGKEIQRMLELTSGAW